MLRTLRLAAPIPLLLLPLLALAAPDWWGPIGAAAIWGLGLIACFWGWGTWVGRRLAAEMEPDFGLRAAWGLAFTVVAGGPLCLLGLARRPVLIAWAFAGIALAAREVVRRLSRRAAAPGGSPRGWRLSADRLILAGLLVLVAVVYVGSAGRGMPNPSDDLVAYLPFIRKLLQTGTIVEPFSVRRMAAYGGQSYLQALTLLGAEDAQIQLFDQGLCFVLLVASIIGFGREVKGAAPVFILLLVLVLAMLPEVRINSASEISGALGFLAAFRTLAALERAPAPAGRWRGAMLAALPIVAVSTLRQNYMVVSGFVTASVLLARGEEPARARWRDFGRVSAMIALGLLPWATLAFRSNHTFLFPLFSGNYVPNYAGITGTSTLEARLRFYVSALFIDEPIRAMPLFILAAPLVAWAANRRALLGLWAGTNVGCALLAVSIPDADMFSVARYLSASVVALVAATSLAASEARAPEAGAVDDGALRGPPRGVVRGAVALVVVALGIQIHGTQAAVVRNLTGDLGRIFAGAPGPSALAGGEADVRKMQAAVPAGERLLVMIERPYHLDFVRNPVALWDQPGAASPRRALPLQDPEGMARYLVGEGYRYFAFALPDAAQNDLYSRRHWKAALGGSQRIWRNTAPLYLAAFDAADHFARTRRRLYDDGHFVVVDLAGASP